MHVPGYMYPGGKINYPWKIQFSVLPLCTHGSWYRYGQVSSTRSTATEKYHVLGTGTTVQIGEVPGTRCLHRCTATRDLFVYQSVKRYTIKTLSRVLNVYQLTKGTQKVAVAAEMRQEKQSVQQRTQLKTITDLVGR